MDARVYSYGISWVLAFLLGAVGTGQTKDEPKSLKATFCELYEQPQKFAGKMIHVQAAVSGYRDPNLDEPTHHEPCSAFMSIRLEFPQNVIPKPNFDLQRDASFQALQEGLHKGMRVIATFEGRFDATFTWRDHKRVRVGEGDGFGKKHSDDGRLVVYRISDVRAVPLPLR